MRVFAQDDQGAPLFHWRFDQARQSRREPLGVSAAGVGPQSVCLFCQERLHGNSLLGRPSLQEIEIFFRHGYGEQCHV